MKKFIYKICILLIGLMIIDYSVSSLLDYGQTSDYKAFIESKEQYDVLDSVDILFVGDSQTADCFVPTVFNETLNLQSFNYGVYLMSPVEQYYLVQDLVERHKSKPKIVVLGSNVNCFNYPVSYGRFTPLFIKNPLNLIPLLLKSKKFEALTSAGRKGYLFSSLIQKLQGNEENVKRKIDGTEYGYLKLMNHFRSRRVLIDCNRDAKFFNEVIVQEQIDYLIKTIEYLNENGIKIVVANPPLHKEFLSCLKQSDKYKHFQNKLNQLSKQYNFKIFNQDHNLLINELEDIDFYNGDHLCYTGAVKFSNAFANYLMFETLNKLQIAEK